MKEQNEGTSYKEIRNSRPLVVLTGPPKDHDDTKKAGEEKVPEGLVQPQVLPLGQAVYDLSYTHYVSGM